MAEEERIIKYRTPFSNTVMDVMECRGWQKVSDTESYDIHWCDVSWLRENFDNSYIPKNVSICHFRNHYELTRKNYMVKNLKRLKKQIEKACTINNVPVVDSIDFFPITYSVVLLNFQIQTQQYQILAKNSHFKSILAMFGQFRNILQNHLV